MRSYLKIILILLLFIVFILGVWHFNIRVFLADYYYKKVVVAKDWPEILRNYNKVLVFQPYEPFYQKRFAKDLKWGLDFYKSVDAKLQVLDLAIDRINKVPEKDQDFKIKVHLARIYALKANFTKDKNDFSISENAIEQVAEISPQMAGVYNDWCQLKIYKEEWEQAEQMCKKAFYLYPDLNHPQMNKDHRQRVKAEMSQVYEKLGNVYISLGNYEKAEQMYIQILKFFPLNKIHIWKKIGDVYYLQGDLDTAIQKNIHGYMLNPKDPAWSRALSLLYLEKGDIETAHYWEEKSK